jgi:hypothetical protein
MRNKLVFLVICLISTKQLLSQVVVGPYTRTTHLTNIAGPCSAATLAILGDTDFTDGSYEIPFGTIFEGTYFYTIKAVLNNDEELSKQGFVQVYH